MHGTHNKALFQQFVDSRDYKGWLGSVVFWAPYGHLQLPKPKFDSTADPFVDYQRVKDEIM